MSETLKTIIEGALGGITFGIYHQYTTNRKMEVNNEKIDLQYKYFMDRMENQHKKDMIEMGSRHKLLTDKLAKLEKVVSKQK
jgi:hypothetical protein